MDLSQLAQVGEFIGGIAVLVTLLYLAVQARQNNKNQKLSATISLQDNYLRAVDQWFGNTDRAAIIIEGLQRPSQLDDARRLRFAAQLFTLYSFIESVFYYNENGQCDPALAKRTFALLSFYRDLPGVSEWWEGRLLLLGEVRDFGKAQFSEEFIEFAETR